MSIDLKPCPFCGGTDFAIVENGRVWAGMKHSDPVSVSVRHWCPATPGQPSRMIERVGRDEDGAIAAWNTRAILALRPVQGEPVTVAVDHFDNGPFEAYTNRIYPSVEIGTKLYTTPQPTQAMQAMQAEVTDSMIREAFLANGFTIKDGHSDLKPYVYAAARAILSLRPERVPMTDLPEGDVTYFDGRGDAVDGYTAERVWEILRSHGITAHAKKASA